MRLTVDEDLRDDSVSLYAGRCHRLQDVGLRRTGIRDDQEGEALEQVAPNEQRDEYGKNVQICKGF